ncbi:MAG: hypothetical protein K2F92_02200 [Alistipes sp.]|nr:hypothetical protein [Alistipes sp.]
MKIALNRWKPQLEARMAAARTRLARARHFRGHGVHSPFVYAIVREVFMRTTLLPGDHALYRALLEAGANERRAMQLQNLAIHEGYDTFGVDRADAAFCIATPRLSRTGLLQLADTAARTGATVAVLEPTSGYERRMLCRQLVAMHRSTSVDNRAYLLLFNNHLPKQHFEL